VTKAEDTGLTIARSISSETARWALAKICVHFRDARVIYLFV
jgi:hypothetical protein